MQLDLEQKHYYAEQMYALDRVTPSILNESEKPITTEKRLSEALESPLVSAAKNFVEWKLEGGDTQSINQRMLRSTSSAWKPSPVRTLGGGQKMVKQVVKEATTPYM